MKMKSHGKMGNPSMGVSQFSGSQTAKPIGKKGKATPPKSGKGDPSLGVGQFGGSNRAGR